MLGSSRRRRGRDGDARITYRVGDRRPEHESKRCIERSHRRGLPSRVRRQRTFVAFSHMHVHGNTTGAVLTKATQLLPTHFYSQLTSTLIPPLPIPSFAPHIPQEHNDELFHFWREHQSFLVQRRKSNQLARRMYEREEIGVSNIVVMYAATAHQLTYHLIPSPNQVRQIHQARRRAGAQHWHGI